jgi:arylsulfatase A-like enzyme
MTHAVSGCPVCCPYRASLLTGQRPLTHGIFLNDLSLRPDSVTLGEVFKKAGYDTAYIGKWHLDGHGRLNFIPRERRHGFDYWKVMECTHQYNDSAFYGDTPEKQKWEGYDALAQTRDAQEYLRAHAGGAKPLLLILSWGPPHNPYEAAPGQFRRLYDPAKLKLRANVPAAVEQQARKDLAGYYAHCSALDQCLGQLWQTLADTGLERNTIFVFTSDHGDMLGSQGTARKQRPWDESIRVPSLWHFPAVLGREERQSTALINAEDVMPTLLGLCGVKIPKTVEGYDYSKHLRTGKGPLPEAALITCVAPFGEWLRGQGGREYRGIRTARYTYVQDLNGPWLLYDNQQDPFQLTNVCNRREAVTLQKKLAGLLKEKLRQTGDRFLPGEDYIKKRGYKIDANGRTGALLQR